MEPGFIGTKESKSKSNGKVLACRESGSYHSDYRAGRLVDENMIVLRKRIRERKKMERSYEAPADWMQWEKQYYAYYDEIFMSRSAFCYLSCRITSCNYVSCI
ncbi:uncharacterized protein Fot_56196 [Forsythia ovata]|uniref:Uncharacterized protein n=1 Tax=Forsythia ovata TaxID=205694 RepID=A0ABD1P0Z7_9LAMI